MYHKKTEKEIYRQKKKIYRYPHKNRAYENRTEQKRRGHAKNRAEQGSLYAIGVTHCESKDR